MEGRKRRRGVEEYGRVKGWREGVRKRREEREQRGEKEISRRVFSYFIEINLEEQQ